MLYSFEAAETVERLCQKLTNVELETYEDREELLLEIGDLLTEQVNNELGELGSVWVKGRDRGKIKPVWAYGADFLPDIAIEVAEMPAVAIEVQLASRDSGTADPVAVALGRGLIYSIQYSYVICLVLDHSDSDVRKHWLDGEIETRLWDSHRISLIVRQ